jgi:hypothetical protein
VGSGEDAVQVVQGEAGGYGVDAYGELGDVLGTGGSGEEGADVGASLGLEGGGYAVFEIVAGGVEGEREGEGFLEELWGGGWYYMVS